MKRIAGVLTAALLAVLAACPVFASQGSSDAVQTGDGMKMLLIIAGVVIVVAVIALVVTNVVLKKKK